MKAMFTTTHKIKLTTIVLGSVAALGCSDLARANEADVAPTAAINTAQIDFTSPSAVKSVKAKVYFAARDLCYKGVNNDGFPSTEERACYANAVSNAFARIDQLQQVALANQARRIALAPQLGATAANR